MSVVEGEGAFEKVVFVLMVSWTRGSVEDRDSEYGRVKARLPEGTDLFVGCNVYDEKGEELLDRPEERVGVGRRVRYDALLVLRGRLARMEEVIEWFELREEVTRGFMVEPSFGGGLGLKDFMDWVQQKCKLRGETYGSWIIVERGDAETMSMLEKASDKERSDETAVERYTERMREYQKMEKMEKMEVEEKSWCLIQ